MSMSLPILTALFGSVWLPLTSSYCSWAGANPSWKGAPNVEQVTVITTFILYPTMTCLRSHSPLSGSPGTAY